MIADFFEFKDYPRKNLKDQEKVKANLPKFIPYEEIHYFFEKIIEKEPSNTKSISNLKNFVKQIIKKIQAENHRLITDSEIKEQIRKMEQCREAERDKLADCLIRKLNILWDLAQKNPELFESKLSELLNEQEGLQELNRVLSYKIKGKELSLRALPARTVKNKTFLYLQAIKLLLEKLKNLPGIEYVTATSHLVKQHQKLFEKLGFQIENFSSTFPPQEQTQTPITRVFARKDDLLKNFSLFKKNQTRTQQQNKRR